MISPLLKTRPGVLCPLSKRLPKRKGSMTLVAAFRCPKGGILLCADREENDGFTRREVDKIYKINLVPCQVFIAGAGPSGIVTNANSHIHGALAKALSDGKDIIVEHKNIIETALKELHNRYSANLKTGYLDLLIVVAPQNDKNVPMLCGGPGCSDSFRRFLSGSPVFRFRLPEVLTGG